MHQEGQLLDVCRSLNPYSILLHAPKGHRLTARVALARAVPSLCPEGRELQHNLDYQPYHLGHRYYGLVTSYSITKCELCLA